MLVKLLNQFGMKPKKVRFTIFSVGFLIWSTRELMMEMFCDCEDENIEELCGVWTREDRERKDIGINLSGNGLDLY